MKVLHLPTNVASQISVTVRALRDIGVDARGLVLKNAPAQDDRCIECFPRLPRKKYPIRGTIQRLKWKRAILEAIHWADVVHWHCGTRTLRNDHDLRCAAELGKPRIVEFWGSDIRIPDVASTDNPYVAGIYEENPNMALHLRERSLRNQSRFAEYGFECLIPDAELEPYIQSDLFSNILRSRQRLVLADFEPAYPDPNKQRPLVVHAPSDKAKKGTSAVLEAIEKLRKKYDFEFKLISGMPKDQAVAIYHNCDIMLDQFVLGTHGLACLETMALGKPTMCYIKPSLVKKYHSDLPIVNANQENLTQILADLLENGQKRHEIGRRSRAHIEKHHDAHKIAGDLVVIYEKLISKNRGATESEGAAR